MLRILLKKQFGELGYLYLMDTKTGKRKTGKKAAIRIGLLIAVYLVVIGSLFALAIGIGGALLPLGLDWFYFALMGIMALMLGTFGSAFSTYSSLYCAKDNEMLMAMPIRPTDLLLARMATVYATGFVYSSAVWIPAAVYYWISGNITFAKVLFPLILMFVIALAVHVLSCLLGWVLALLAMRLKNSKAKGLISTALTLLLIGIYYYAMGRTQYLLEKLAQNALNLSGAFARNLQPLYLMGTAATGSGKSLILFTLEIAAAAALCGFVLARSYMRLLTTNKGGRKSVYREKRTKARSLRTALLLREWTRFVTSTPYMVNAGLGLLMMPVAAVLLIVYADTVSNLPMLIALMFPEYTAAIPTVAVACAMVLPGLAMISAPSPSMEGKTLWVIRSLPVPMRDVLMAKEVLHVLLNALPAAFLSVAMGVVLKCSLAEILLMLVMMETFCVFGGALGLWQGIRHINLVWTSETVAVKQGIGVLFTMLLEMLAQLAFMAIGIFVGAKTGAAVAMLICILIMAVCIFLLNRWIGKRGVERMENC